ncbi:DUF6716 putative glycosyltransferase [Krasilnikoviella flava]|uniref:Uncharacterized protein n=1 Tax=Krasilnikoviella flava TaxID=526729 RepID=A0A1T5IA05_9MICO|nr:DUF6716 putative glycosyltransferase [Krasilnikoviella flava]SKC36001.1 hypothetical protein SAMN04324258_0230 [Krasilnikoviella flava]
MTGRTSPRPPRVLAVADADSYLKWAVWTLAGLRADGAPVDVSAVLVRSPIAPTPAQVDAAVRGSGVPGPPTLSPRDLRRLVRRTRPDVVLVAATGPVAELVAREVVRATRPGRRPALLSGLPGMALPATPQGAGWRRWCDAFLVHARVEAGPYVEAFARQGARPDVVLTRLPFLEPSAARAPGSPDAAVRRVVLAAQAKVPGSRDERVDLLDGLARLAAEGLDVVVKLRARAGERQTHNEAHPLDALWAAEHARLGRPGDAVSFVTGPMADQLTPGTALLTVSSTAGLESLALGLPTVFLADFGVGPAQLNEPFARSGCLLRLDEVAAALRAGGPAPDPAWLEEHYLHSAPSGLPAAVHDLARRSRDGALPALSVRPWSRPRHAYTAARSALPVAVGRRLTLSR